MTWHSESLLVAVSVPEEVVWQVSEPSPGLHHGPAAVCAPSEKRRQAVDGLEKPRAQGVASVVVHLGAVVKRG